MSEFTIDDKKLMAAYDAGGEVWLRGADVVEILKSTKRDSEELHEWISDHVLPYTEKSNDSSLYTSDLVLKLKEEVEKKNEEIMLNHKKISKLQRSLSLLQMQLFQIEPKSSETHIPKKENCYLFFLIKKNLEKIENDMDYFPYYALRTKERFAQESLDRLKSKYPLSEVIYRVEDPPEVDLFNRLTELEDVKSCENHLESNLNDEELISLFEKLKFLK
ncbi:unnamed protein product [Nezara viridula]|uniref:DUF3627 domain-containing protein n=1 Tax=Nezara viridula TaxID=85310 RepID=A0A9P0HQ36_NEZVI|nr:unnamed protein product [Nezara viridula]